MSFTRDTAKASVQKAIYDLVKYGLGALWVSFGPAWLSSVGRDRFGLTAGDALAWAIVLALVLPFVGLFVWDWWDSSRTKANAPDKQSALVHLERYYMILLELRAHVDRILQLVADGRPSTDLYQCEIALDRIRAELMNLAPLVIPMSVAVDFQKEAVTHVHVEKRVPTSIDLLMRKVHRHWMRYAEVAGITPLPLGMSKPTKPFGR